MTLSKPTIALAAFLLIFGSLGAVFVSQNNENNNKKSSDFSSAANEKKNNNNNLRRALNSAVRMLAKGGGGGGGKGKPTPPPPTTASPTSSPTIGTTGSPTACGAAISPLAPMPGKKGACFTLRDPAGTQGGTWDENMPKVIKLNPKWNYSWGNKRAPNQPDNIEFVPMIWGYYGDTNLQNGITNNVMPEVAAGRVKRLLGYNEPDNPNQSNIAVDTVVASWPILEATGLPLGGPSITHIGGAWHTDFVAKADANCLRYEYHAVHWYGGAGFESFKTSMQSAYGMAAPRPLLITEFAPADWNAATPADNKFSQAQVLAFMKLALPWLEAQDWIVGYSWFSFKQSSAAGTSSALFVDGTTDELTPLGQFYASVTPENPNGNQTITV